MTTDWLAGRWIRQYQLLEPLGGGSFGTVYRARHRDLKIDRAFKVLRETLSQDPEVRARFVQEAQTAAHLRHPNIVPVYDVFDEEGLLCIVMELVDSWTLADRVRKEGPLPPAEAGRVALQVGAALDHAHARGIVHRDVKPSNVMLRLPDQTPLLTDFGIASVRTPVALDRPEQTLGTVAYMPPEQFGVTGAQPDWRSDVYSLAAVFYEMVTGQAPYGRGPEAVGGHLGQRALTPASAHNRALPERVDEVLAQGLAQEPARRQTSAGDLARQFAAALTGQPVDAVTEILLGLDVVAAAAARRRTRRRASVVIAAVAAAALLVGTPVAVVLARGAQVQDPQRPPGVTNTMVENAVVGALDRCFDPQHLPPWSCPRLQGPHANETGWQVRGDPTAGDTVRYQAGGTFVVNGHFVAVHAAIADPARVDSLDAGAFLARVHWDDETLDVQRIDRVAKGPPVPDSVPEGNAGVLGLTHDFLGLCAKQVVQQSSLHQGCPYHLVDSTACPSLDLYTSWKQGSDPVTGANVAYDPTTGLYRVTGTYSLQESIVQPAQCHATAQKQGGYELVFTLERDKMGDANANPAFLQFTWQ